MPLDGSCLEDRSLVVGQAVEPSSEQRVDRRRNLERDGVAALLEHEREHLLDEERISTRRLDDVSARRVLELPRAREVVDELCALGLGKRLELHGGGVQLPPTPLRPELVQLRSSHA